MRREYITGLQRHAAETRNLLSNAQKPERERMVVRAFLRCIGEGFSDDEVQASAEEPVDVNFRSARFQVTDILGDRKRGDAWRERERRYRAAKRLSEVVEPWTSSEPMSVGDVSQAVSEHLSEKAIHYGVQNCSRLDALVYVDVGDRHLWPVDRGQDSKMVEKWRQQGWRSVSMLFVPYGSVLAAQASAPDFLQETGESHTERMATSRRVVRRLI
jgi:hypothetical protein